jgi:Rrf2 family transcriptional repressor of oqxAB
MIDIRFPTALQMMLTLANSERNGITRVTSTQLAYGLGATPSLVRKLLVPLGRDHLVRSSLGKTGGVGLARPASEIPLREIFLSVTEKKRLWIARPNVPHRCDVSSHIEEYFGHLTGEAERAVLEMLGRRTLAESLDEVLALKRASNRRRASRARANAS